MTGEDQEEIAEEEEEDYDPWRYYNYRSLKEMTLTECLDELMMIWALGSEERGDDEELRLQQVIVELNDRDFGRGLSYPMISDKTGISTTSLSTRGRKYRLMIAELRKRGDDLPPGDPTSEMETAGSAGREGERTWEVDLKVIGPSASHLQNKAIKELGERVEGAFKFRLNFADIMEKTYPSFRAASEAPEEFANFFHEGMEYWTRRGPALESSLIEHGQYNEVLRKGWDELELICDDQERKIARLELKTRRLMRALRSERSARVAVADFLRDIAPTLEAMGVDPGQVDGIISMKSPDEVIFCDEHNLVNCQICDSQHTTEGATA